MKKAMILCICILLLTACTVLKNNVGNDSQNTAIDSGIIGSSITTSAVSGDSVSNESVTGASMGEQEGRENREKVKVRFVTDETGQKQKLRLGDVNVKDAGVYFKGCEDFLSRYSQVSDGHYYFLKKNDDGDYMVYRDKGSIVGQFSIYDGVSKKYGTDYDYSYVAGFVKYGTEFYALVNVEYGDLIEFDDYYWYKTDLAHVDLETGEIEIICNLVSGDNMKYITRIDKTQDIVYFAFYKDKMYFTDVDVYEKREALFEDREEDNTPKNLVKKDMDNGCPETIMPSTANMDEAKPYLTIMDGKIYYGQQKGKKVTLYAYDLENYQEQKIFSYQRKQPYQGDYIWGRTADDVFLEMDEDYIYCQEFIIPRAGGKIIPVFRQAVVYEDGRMPYAHNKKYIFYIDKEYKLHRFSKKAKSDVIISDMKIMDVYCTEKNIYVKEYDKRYTFDELEEHSYFETGNVYCMDMDGEHVERIVKRVND